MFRRKTSLALATAWLGAICGVAWGAPPLPTGGSAGGLRPAPNLGAPSSVSSPAGGERVLPPPARRPPGGGPWERDLLIAASEDGTTFAPAETFVEGGGVPSAIRDAKGRLVAAFQWFPANDPAHFDRVAVKTSEDGGKTWSAPQPITVEGLPGTYQRPFDPTLALAADGRIRLYFSCSSTGRRMFDESVATYSAISADGARCTFEPGVRFSAPGRPVIDCAVVRLGEKWHYTAPRGRPEEGAYHAVSADGLSFTRVDDIPSVDGANWLGNLLPCGDGMRFYGGSGRGMWWAFSGDGVAWTRPTYLGFGGGDPAAVQVSDKRFLIIYTGEPRRRGPPPGAGPRPPREGPYTHAVLSASSPDGLTWTRDPGTRIEHASVPCAVADGDKRILLYYVDADRGPGRPESVGCAVSEDGLSFTRQPFAIEGLPADKALDPCVLKDEAGAYRLYYLASSMAGDPARDPRAHRVRLAVSQDGIRFKDADLALERPGLVDPDVFPFKGQWFMYVFGGGATLIATSPDGRRFTYRQDLDLPNWGTTAPVLLEDGRLRLYAFEQRKRAGNAVRSFISTDGFKWAAEDGTRLAAGPDEQITDPFVIRWKGGYRMFFKKQDAGAVVVSRAELQ